MTTVKTTIGILGLGTMGRAIFNALRQDKSYRFAVHSLGITRVAGARVCKSIAELAANADHLFVCVKPQEFYALDKVIFKNKKLIVISIMAGVPAAALRRTFPGARVVRTMPNLALQVGSGVTGWYAPPRQFSNAELKRIENILKHFGLDVKVQDELLLDAVTAVSGSGPAYVFVFAAALTKAAEKFGFATATARAIVAQTIAGAVSYAQHSGLPWDELAARVTSKKGTTAAALQTLDVKDFKRRWERAVRSAYRRARELSRAYHAQSEKNSTCLPKHNLTNT